LTDINAVRSAIATNIGTISGLRTSAELPDNPNPPIAVVQLDTVNYDEAFQQGLTLFIDEYCSQGGASSIKLAVESDKSLDGNAYDVRVVGMNNIGSLQLNDQEYLAAEFSVVVYA